MPTGVSIRHYLELARGQTIPPLLLEVLLSSGRSFYIKSVFESDDDAAELIPLRVWDLRALSEKDLSELAAKLDKFKGPEPPDLEKLHPRLDQGNLWVRLSDIEAIMEWHDRFWPEPDESERRIEIGFRR
jgi:hypothetical protein